MQQTEMPAVVFDRAGDAADVLRWATAPLPAPCVGQVRVRVTARVIEPADFLFVSARYRLQPQYPQVAGLEGAGIVDAMPPGEDTALLGRRVAFRAAGAWAEYAVAPRTRVYEVPDDIDDALACQFALNPQTAWALLDVAAAPPGGRILLTAGASTVARLVAAPARPGDDFAGTRQRCRLVAWLSRVDDRRTRIGGVRPGPCRRACRDG